MSTLYKKDLHSPLNNASILKVIAHIKEVKDQQTASAATATTKHVATHAGGLQYVYFISSKAAGAGESMVIDVQKNGVTVLSSTFTFNNTKAANTKYVLALAAGVKINPGDVISIIRTYTAGGTPTPLVETVVGVGWS